MQTNKNIIYLKEIESEIEYYSGIIYNFENIEQLESGAKNYFTNFINTKQTAIFKFESNLKSQIKIDPIKIFKLIEKEINQIKIINDGIYFKHIVPFIIRKNKLEEFRKIVKSLKII